MSQVMFIVRGPQGSGKSTFSKKWVAEDPYSRGRVNRDDIRFSVYGSYVIPFELENTVSSIEEAQITALLASKRSVIIDNVNLKKKYVERYLKIAAKLGVPVVHRDFVVDLDEALRRNSARDRVVPEDVIKKTYSRFVQSGKLPEFPVLSVEEDVYVPDEDLDKAWIVDVDGTIADLNGRSPYDYSQVLNDEPILPVIELVRLLKSDGHKILITSGRDEVCRDDTLLWLQVNDVPYDSLFMRPAGSGEKDYVVKRRIFNENIRSQFNVKGVFDDRLQVCELWHSLGLPLYRVGDPNAVF